MGSEDWDMGVLGEGIVQLTTQASPISSLTQHSALICKEGE